jgi:uncharacterized protein (TIGR03067 family)
MTRWLTILAGPLVAVCALTVGPADRDQKALQGDWVLEALQINGDVVAINSLKFGKTPLTPRLTVKGERYTLYLADKPVPMLYRLDLGHSPKWITLTYLEGPEKGKAFRGIYKLEGDRFTICRPMDAAHPRPDAFATTPDSGLMLGVWKRVRP